MPAGPKVLVVDDESSVCLVLNRFLSAAGYRVLESRDGVDAIEKAENEKPSLILLDVEMPLMNGWETLKALRRRGCRVPVLMLTNVDNVPARVKGLEAGADDYMGKPCDLIELRARVKALIRRSQTLLAKPMRLRFGRLLVDFQKMAATRGGEEIGLTKTEFALLGLLAEHRGRPVSRELILRVVWNGEAGSNSHTVDTCLWRLRKKIGDDGRASRWIVNLPGIGYVLECEFDDPQSSEA
jgi:DNA-binding response OmpR family regulator